jgi:hypothetical protein
LSKVVAIMSMSLDGYVADANDGVAEVFDWYFSGDVEAPQLARDRASSSSPTASKAPSRERNRLPTRSPWECTASKRSGSA